MKNRVKSRVRAWGLAGILVLAACPGTRDSGPRDLAEAPPEPEFVATAETALRKVSTRVLRELVDDGEWSSLELALERNRLWLATQPAEREFTYGSRTVRADQLSAAFEQVLAWLAEEPSPVELASRLESTFDVAVNVADGRSRMLVTGYYEPLIAGSLQRSDEYSVPVYGPPPDLFRIDLGDFGDQWAGKKVTGLLSGQRLLPYPDRREIRLSSRLRGREIAWARDVVDLFFVEVQGSGALLLPDGRELRIGYAGANGRQYRSIGKLLIEEGEIEREAMSMQALRAYLAAHPEQVERVLDHNESQVFFRRLNGPPLGSLGVAVTPGRSIAADHSLLPPGALGFLRTEVPGVGDDGATVAVGTLRRFVLNQDTGGAIRGAHRADFFWGRGDEAALRAGLMKQPGKLYVLIPKEAAVAEQ